MCAIRKIPPNRQISPKTELYIQICSNIGWILSFSSTSYVQDPASKANTPSHNFLYKNLSSLNLHYVAITRDKAPNTWERARWIRPSNLSLSVQQIYGIIYAVCFFLNIIYWYGIFMRNIRHNIVDSLTKRILNGIIQEGSHGKN